MQDEMFDKALSAADFIALPNAARLLNNRLGSGAHNGALLSTQSTVEKVLSGIVFTHDKVSAQEQTPRISVNAGKFFPFFFLLIHEQP